MPPARSGFTTTRPSASTSRGRPSRSATGYATAQYPALRHSAAAASASSAPDRGSRSHAPSSAEDRCDELVAPLRLGLGQLGQPVTTRGLEHLPGRQPVLGRLFTQFGDHADRRARARSMRWTSMLPDATVEACA